MDSAEFDQLRSALEFGQLRARVLRTNNHDPGDEDPNETHPDESALTEDEMRDLLRQGREERRAAEAATPTRRGWYR